MKKTALGCSFVVVEFNKLFKTVCKAVGVVTLLLSKATTRYFKIPPCGMLRNSGNWMRNWNSRRRMCAADDFSICSKEMY